MAAPTILTGMVTDADILSNERVIDMDDVIAFLDPDESQFTTMLMKVSSSPAHSSKVEWLEDQLFPRLATQSGGATSGTTTINVATGNGAFFRAGDIFRNARTGEAVLVTSIATDALTVVRGQGRVSAAAMLDQDQLLIVANATVEGGTLGTRVQTKRVAQFNYCQIVRNPYGFAETLIASKLYGGPVPEKERQKKAIEHKRSIEYLLFWGARGSAAPSGSVRGEAGGLFEFVTTNVNNASGALTKTLLDTYFRQFLQHGSRNKVMFAAPVVCQAISGFLRDIWQPNTNNVSLWGAYVDGFISGAYGYRVPVICKKDWNDFSTASTQYGGWAFVVDMDMVKFRPLRNSQLLRGRQANDADTQDEEYLAEISLEVQQEQAHGIIQGVTS